jgi:uncharacterized protein
MGTEFAEVIRNGFEAFGRGDLDYLRDNVFTEDTVWHVGGRNLLSGDYRGQEMFDWFGRLFQETGGTFQIQVHDVTTSDDHAVVLTESSAERKGKRLEGSKGLQVHHFVGGKVSESWLTAENQYELDDFWS